MTMKPHPHCGHLKPLFAHSASGPCDWCLTDIERAYLQPRAAIKTWADIRGERAVRLEATDWVDDNRSRVARSSPELVAAIRAYRQKLFDITTDFATPESVVWPTPPASI